jgi:hypothetical protein
MTMLLAAAYCAYGTMGYTRETATFTTRSECTVFPTLQPFTVSEPPIVSETPTPTRFAYSTSPPCPSPGAQYTRKKLTP